MPKILTSDLADRVEAEIARHPTGVSASTIARTFEDAASRRSIMRIIKRLQRAHRISAEGQARATRYRASKAIAGTAHVQEADDTVQATGEIYLPLSPEGEMVRSWVRAPITQ